MMKSSVAIVLILSGMLLVALPALSDAAWMADTVRLLERPGVSNVNLAGQMELGYRVGCCVAGVACIGIAIRYSIQQPHGEGASRVEDIA